MAERKPQQDRGRERRDAILVGASRRFAEHGFSDSSLRDIANEAGCTIGSIYFFFATKDDLATAILTEQGERVNAAVTTAYANNIGVAGILWAAQATADLMATDVLVRAGMRLSRDLALLPHAGDEKYDAWLGRIQQVLITAQSAGEVKANLDPAAVAQTIVLLFVGTDVVATSRLHSATTHSMLRNALSVVLEAIATPAALGHLSSVLDEALPPA